ncbi:hypothetical protein CISIN_1g035658mg, partial [Citrus sinensis]
MVLPNLRNDLVIFSLAFFILFCVLNFPLIVSSYSMEETRALLRWKTSLQNHNNGSPLSSWTLNNVTKIGSCAWVGIHCNYGERVNSMNLTSIGLKGTLHDFSFSSFPHLAYLDLQRNQLFGNIPPQIGNISKLKYLGLSSNLFSGAIPPQIGHLSYLKTLHLFENQLSGSIPHSLGNLTNLVTLYIYNNSLSGSIPSELGNLKSLSNLALSSNKLSGSIPQSLGNLSNLAILYIYNNSLSGLIPSEIGNLKSLSNL